MNDGKIVGVVICLGDDVLVGQKVIIQNLSHKEAGALPKNPEING